MNTARSSVTATSVHLGGPIVVHGTSTDTMTTGPSVFTDTVYYILCEDEPLINNII